MKRPTRRTFIQAGAIAATAVATGNAATGTRFRLGGPVPRKHAETPAGWVREHQKLGYRAGSCRLDPKSSDADVRAFAKAATDADIVISEVPAFGVNPISTDDAERKQAIETCAIKLDLADRVGARCCVNTSGSRGKEWAGHDKGNLTESTFDLIVESVRAIIDAVKPTRSWYTLELMPWALPDSIDSYVRFIKAVDRKGFGVHFDPVNIISSPQRYYSNADIIRDGFKRLGPWMKSIHAKDILMADGKLTTHLDEVLLGTGNLDYVTFVRELRNFPDVPVMLEHLKTQELYKLAADHIRGVAKSQGLSFE
jgi:sugar phosphate isomerase/epimerase